MSRRLCAGLAVVAALACPGAASAAYAPRLGVELSPPRADQAAAVTLRVTQAPGDEATASFVADFPFGFIPVEAANVPACSDQDWKALRCPAGSALGTVTAQTALTSLNGQVYRGVPTADGQVPLHVQLSSQVPGVAARIDGVFSQTAFGVVFRFDNLPLVTLTRFELRLQGGRRALVRNPEVCGVYEVQGGFAGQMGSTATNAVPVGVGGCPGPQVSLTGARLSPSTLVEGRRATLRFQLSADAVVVIEVRRASGRLVRRDAQLYSAGARQFRGIGKSLAPGRYRVEASAEDDNGRRSPVQRLPLTVVPPPA